MDSTKSQKQLKLPPRSPDSLELQTSPRKAKKKKAKSAIKATRKRTKKGKAGIAIKPPLESRKSHKKIKSPPQSPNSLEMPTPDMSPLSKQGTLPYEDTSDGEDRSTKYDKKLVPRVLSHPESVTAFTYRHESVDSPFKIPNIEWGICGNYHITNMCALDSVLFICYIMSQNQILRQRVFDEKIEAIFTLKDHENF